MEGVTGSIPVAPTNKTLIRVIEFEILYKTIKKALLLAVNL